MLNKLRASCCAGLTDSAGHLWADDAPIAKKKLTVMLDWFVNPRAALIVARKRLCRPGPGGRWPAADPNDPTPKLAAASKVDLAVTYQPQLTIHVNAGLPRQTDWHVDRNATEFAGGAEGRAGENSG
ncbi:MAG: hypothetical protein U1F42_10715 [Candidatus Competibacteraceae bacterium]